MQIGDAIPFHLPFDYEPHRFGKRVTDGWQMTGQYKTVTDKYGDSFLRVNAILQALLAGVPDFGLRVEDAFEEARQNRTDVTMTSSVFGLYRARQKGRD